MNCRNNILIKSIAIVTAVVFMVNTAVLAVPVQKPLDISYQPSANIFIPEQYGRIEKSVNSKSPEVILIKDAHCVYEAQKNISRILDILIRDYNIDLVCVEGAVDKVDTSRFCSYADTEAREKVAEKYLKNGLFTAGEALSIKNGANPGFAIYGVEDAKLYWKDFQAFRDTVDGARINNRFLELMDSIVFQLKKKLYSQRLLEFDDRANEYKNGKLSLTDWVKILSKEYGVRSKNGFKNFRLVVRAIILEEKIDFKKVETERASLIKRLEGKLTREDLKELVKNSILFKLGKLSALDYYTYLEGIGNALMGENLRRYVKLVKVQARIDEDELFRELALTEEGIYKNLIPDEITGKIHRLDKDLNILKNILQLKANRGEILYYKENRANFTLDRFLDFIKIQAPLNGIPLPKEFNTPSFLEEVKKSISPSEEFYELALKRDEALVNNLLKRMGSANGAKKDKAILVCGGFHAEGIGNLLRDKGINLVTISPAITKAEEDSQNLYLSRMLDERIKPVNILSQLGLGNIQPVVPHDTALPKTVGDLLLAGPEIDIQRFCNRVGVGERELRKLTIKDLDRGLLRELEEEYVTTDDDAYAGFLELVFSEYNKTGTKEQIDSTTLREKRENIQEIKSELIANFLMESLGGKGRLILLTLAKHSFGAGDISPERFMEELYSGGIEAVNRCLGIDIELVVFSIIKTWQEAEKAREEGRTDNEAYRKMGEFLGIIDENIGYVWHEKAPQFFAHLEKLSRVIENVNNFPETMLRAYRIRVYLSISDEIEPNILDNIDFILSVINEIPEEIRARYKPYLYIYLHKRMDSIGESNVYHEKGGINLKMVDAIRDNQERRKVLAAIVVHEFFHKLVMGINAEGTDLIFPIRDWIDFLLLNGIGTVITEGGEVGIEEYLDLDRYGLKEVKKRLHKIDPENIRYEPRPDVTSGRGSYTPTRDVEGEYYKKEIADPQELLAHMIASEIFRRDNFVYYEESFEVFSRHLLASSLSGSVYRYNREQMRWEIKEETGFYSKDTTEGKGSIPWIEKRFGRFGFVVEELVFRLAPFWIMYFINISSPLAGGLCMAVIGLIGGYIFIKLHPAVEDKKVALKISVKNYLFLLIVFIKDLYSPISTTFLIISVLAIPLLVHFYENKYGGRAFLKWKWVLSKLIIWFLIITNPFILPNKSNPDEIVSEATLSSASLPSVTRNDRPGFSGTLERAEVRAPPFLTGFTEFHEERQTQMDLHVLNGREPLDHSLDKLLYDWYMRHDRKFRKELKEEERSARIKKLAEGYKKEGKYNPLPKEIEEYCGKIADLISPLMGDATWDGFSSEQMRFILEALLEAESDNEHWIVREKDGKPEVKVLGSGKGAYGISQITEIAVRELGRRVWLDLRIVSGKTKVSPSEKEKAGRRLKIIYQLLFTNDLSLQGYQNLDLDEVKRHFESIPDEKGKDRKDFGPLIQYTWDTWSFNLRASAAIVFTAFDYINAEMDKLGFKEGEPRTMASRSEAVVRGSYPILRLIILSYNWNYYHLIEKVKELKDRYGEDFSLSWYLVFIRTSEGPFHWFRFFDRFAQIAGYSLEGKEYCWVPPVVDYLARRVHEEKAAGVMREARWIINKLDFTLAKFVRDAEKKKLDLTKVGDYLGVAFGSNEWREYIKRHYTLRRVLFEGIKNGTKGAGPHKVPGPTWTDEDWQLFKEQVEEVKKDAVVLEDRAKINEAVEIANSRAKAGINPDRVVIHTVQSDRLGIPKRKGATSVHDMVYTIGEKGKDGELHIYVTSRYWNEVLSQNPLHLAEAIDHEWQENVLGKTHRQAAGRARFFVKKGEDLSEYHIFVIQQILSEGFSGLLYLAGILAEERKGNYEEKFRRYIEEKIKSANPSCAILGSGDSAFYECIEGRPIIMTRTGDENRIKIEKEPVGEDDFEYTVIFIDKNGNRVGDVSFLDSGRELIINGYVLYMKGDTIKITNIKDKNSYVVTETTVISEELFNEGVITPVIGYTGDMYNDKGIPSWGELLRGVKREGLVRSAIDKIKGQSGRVGNFVDIKGVSRLIVVGDMHGNYKNLMDILSTDNIWDDLKAGKAHLVILGDAIHPGSGDLACDAAQEDSVRMLLLLMKLIAELPQGSVTYVLGDHELSHLDERYGIKKGDVYQDKVFEEYIIRQYGEEFLNIVKNFLKTLPYAVRINGEIVLTHAGASENLISEEHLKMLDAEEDDIDMLNLGLLIGITFRMKREVKEREINWFLRTLNCSLLITGHTPPSYVSGDMYNFSVVKKGAIGCAYGKQLIVDSQTDSPGYIDMDMKKSDTRKGLVDLVDRGGRPALKVLGIDIVEEVVDEIMGIFNKYGLRIERKDVWEAVVMAKGEVGAPPLERLFSLLRDIPQLDLKGLFALTKEISGPLNKIIPDFDKKRGGEIVANVLTEILGEVEVKGKVIAEGENIREKFFNTVKRLLVSYGVTEAELAGELELVELGLFLLEYEPLLKITKVDKAYLDYLALVCELAGVEPDTLRGIFGNAYLAYQNKETLDKLVERGVDVDKLTREELELELKRKGLWSRFKRLDEIYDMMETGFTGVEVCSGDSILSRVVRRLRLYQNIVDNKINTVSGLSEDMAGLDFKGVSTQRPQELVTYLSGTSVAVEGGGRLIDALGVNVNKQITVSISEELFIEEIKGNRITYSPGIWAVLRRVPNLTVEIRTEEIAKIQPIIDLLIKEHSELDGRVIIKGEIIEKDRTNTVYVLGEVDESLADAIKNNRINAFFTNSMALYSVLIYGALQASVKTMFENDVYTPEAKDVIRKLEIFGVSKETIDKILNENQPLIIITTEQLLRQYQLYRATIEIAA